MPTPEGRGYVDYVLWGDDGKPLGLVVMATGAGKTRTVIALCDLLMRCNWVRRVLFLADRVALVKQAVNAFKKHLPASSPVSLVTEKDKEGRVFVSTYPTMMRLIDETADGQRQFGVGHFDLIVIDEAHRSVYQKYGAILDYFDALLVGLTATPKDEIDRNTYSIFNLERGVPTDVYGLEEACKDQYLVQPQTVSVPLKFQRDGIQYDDLSEEEQEQWDAQEWNEDGTVPTFVEPEAVNQWLFNQDTVDKVLAHLMTRGLKVAGGDRLGKTIIFAKSQPHAEFIAKRFDANYPHLKGEFARVIHCNLPYAQSLIEDVSNPHKSPHIAISVDMLDTGIDVPEFTAGDAFERFRAKARAFLREHVDHLAIHRLHTNQPLTPTDLAELERMLLESGVGSAADWTKAKETASGLGRFVRSLVGLDRGAAKAAFAGFLAEQNASANQIEFINMIINHLTDQGTMSPERLYESPFIDLHPLGVEGVFGAKAGGLVEILEEIERRAAA